MKAFLTRLNRGLSKEKDKDKDVFKEKVPSLPPLGEWPPQQRASSTPPSVASTFKPLPDLSTRPLPPIDEPSSESPASSLTPTPATTTSPLPSSPKPNTVESAPQIAPSRSGQSRSDQDSAGRSSRKTANGSSGSGSADVHKKVAFISPPPTPGPQSDRQLPSVDAPSATNGGPLKSSVSRFQATQGKEPRGSTSTAASSKTDITSTLKSGKPASTRGATSPVPKHFNDGASMHQSLRSTTPYSQMTNASSRILAVQSWSEGAEEDLVSNLGQRERTRQEVLWEIVASEERYVNELVKLKETFIEPLLHPYSTSPVSSPVQMEYDDFTTRLETPRESLEYLPIAARFLSPTGSRSDGPSGQVPRKDETHKDTPNIDGESLNSEEEEEAEDRLGNGYSAAKLKAASALSQAAKHNHPRSPYGSAAVRTATGRPPVPFPSRSHQSLPPPPRMNPLTASSQSLGRQSFVEANGHYGTSKASTTATSSTRVLRKFKKSNPPTPSVPVTLPGAVPPTQIPEDLRKCLEVIESGVLEGHIRLSDSLRKRYEEQYPLVRSLADVFVTNSHILHGYATYVLHLERALEQVDNALSANATKKPKKQDADQWLKVCQYLQKLETIASEKGETGLAISLSKPFQRLLKYPLLFQNLLFHTDPSTYEYESTLQMVAEVETIVRSIEDEKIQKEERDKTRDVFARIEGLEKEKQLMIPKASRILMEERPLSGVNPLSDPNSKLSPPPASQNPKGVKGKSSFKRLSDVLQSGSNGVGGKRDIWLVVFNDVALRCQRTGTTSLPLVAATNSRSTSLPELQGKAKYATTGRRNSHTKPRNMYKFLKIETWTLDDIVQSRSGVVSMEDVARSRQQDDEDGIESDDSDRKSKMSFSYWGADKVTLQKPVVKPRAVSGNGARRGGPSNTQTTAYGRESSANAKFGTRLVSAEVPNGNRPASRRTQTTPTSRRPTTSEESHAVKVTVTSNRPAWDGSTRATSTPVPKRSRNVSQNSSAARNAATKLASPAPSEDSGVGFYRNLVQQNPSLVKLSSSAT
ncbi:hypothetical protein QCA50_002913 [Cerrena zonata]|uniref:DH domain-containing protein n=1 Tax=Cerrena zonata TaxID=2478898 RepID=A0AAW0GJ49_9APHY